MKAFLFSAAFAITFFSLTSCEEEKSNAQNIQRMSDTIGKLYPTVNRISVEVREREDVIITLGDADLFNAPEEKKKEVSRELGELSNYFFAKDNHLEGGKVIFTRDERNLEVKDADKTEMDMPAEAFKKQ